MRPAFVIRLVGLFLLLFSLTLIPPALLAAWGNDGQLIIFLESVLILALPGLLLWLPTRRHRGNLYNREVFLIVSLFWVLLGTLGSIPLLLGTDLILTDAVFEAVSGFTTTGATAIVGIDNLPLSILYYRQQLQWFGGLGVIVLAVAILPMLGVGGMQLYLAETPGPMKNERLTPRIAQTARFMLIIYFALTVTCAAAYWLAGMSLFDAIAHSMSTVSTGGLSTHDASIGHFDNLAIEIIAIVFMLIGSLSFSVHFMALRGPSPSVYWHDTQSRVFLLTVLGFALLTGMFLWLGEQYPTWAHSLRHGAFQVVSVITTTGFSTGNFAVWPLGLPMLLIFVSFFGGCAGSTSGGIKAIRIIVLAKVGIRELQRLIHPQLVRPIKIGDRPVPKLVLDAIWSFFSIYIMIFAALVLALMATGVDQVTAFGAVATSLNNLGPGLGEVASTFHDINPTAKWLCTLAMLLGRLEIFTLLVLLTPEFWRK